MLADDGVIGCAACSVKKKCTTCKEGFFLTLSVTSPPDPDTCVACDTTSNNCKVCESGIACKECKSGYFLDPASKKCASLAETCDKPVINAPVNNCKICLSKTDCKICNEKFFLKTGDCEKCSAFCTQCSSGDLCQTCEKGFVLITGATSDFKICSGSCPVKSFEKVAADGIKTCKDCLTGCQSCTSATTCALCQEGFFSTAGGSATVPDKCTACPFNCKTCKGVNQCTLCKLGFFALNVYGVDVCYSQCPAAYFQKTIGTAPPVLTCEKCGSDCDRCDSDIKCRLCKTGYFIDEVKGSCAQACPNDSYADSLLGACTDKCTAGQVTVLSTKLC